MDFMVIFNCFGTKTLEFLNVSTNMMLHVFSTVNSEIFARILFSRIALKDIFAT